MRRLDRRLSLFCITLCAAAWLCRSELGLEAQTLAPDAHLVALAAAAPERRMVEAIVRDPFAGSPERDGTAGLLTAAAADTVSAGVRVPDIDTASANTVPATQLAVRAAIVGSNPVAYVDDGAGMQIVRIGDVVGGRNVSAIDLQGIAFSDGTRLNLPAGPTRENQGGSYRAFLRPRAPHAPASTSTLPTSPRVRAASLLPASPLPGLASPSPAPELLYSTPAPLRTADARGLAPGVNPTPDLFDPTPFSYPYPYPPPH